MTDTIAPNPPNAATTHARPPLRFSVDDADRAGEEWRFSCGPASICAVLGLTPDEVRPHMQDFEQKGYTNPTLMWAALRSLGAKWRVTASGKSEPFYPTPDPWPRYGLARVQWAGPWTQPGVPMAARYRHTHWVAADDNMVFDVNATCVGGWISREEWAAQLVPWLLRECEPKADGRWWLTHAVEVSRG
jgi:hypothetical protein